MKIIFQFFLLSLLFTTNGYTQDQIVGDWFAKELDHSTIQIYNNKGSYFGKIIKSDISEYIGQIVLKDVVYDKATNTWKGTIYSLKRKMEIEGTLSLESNDKLKIIGRKYFMKKTFYWIRR